MIRKTKGTEHDTRKKLSDEERARLESRNALRQFDAAKAMIDGAIRAAGPFKLDISTICTLNYLATVDVGEYPGILRPCAVTITGSSHTPPPPREVPGLVAEMCEHVNLNWDQTPIYLPAYLMWHINWIHPFADGNGRTARMAAYVVLCIRLGFTLPGTKTIPAQIAENKSPYYAALEAADAAFKNGSIDVSAMERLMDKLLAVQLLAIHNEATDQEN